MGHRLLKFSWFCQTGDSNKRRVICLWGEKRKKEKRTGDRSAKVPVLQISKQPLTKIAGGCACAHSDLSLTGGERHGYYHNQVNVTGGHHLKKSRYGGQRRTGGAKGLVYMQAAAIRPEVTTVSSTVSKEVERANKSD